MILSPSTVEDLAKALKEARAKNRQIVPIVGAGLSADSGFPIITAVVRYFGKLYRYIEAGGPIKQTVKVRFVEGLFKKYKNEPWKFVEHFGWPDRFQLNQDLFTQNHAQKRGDIGSVANRITTADDFEGIKLIETAMIDGLEALLRTLNLNPQGLRAFDSLRKDIENLLPEAEFSEKLQTIQQRFKQDWSKSIPFELLGDWRRLILYFTDFQSDYADALFARFGATRKPGQGHQFLAFLAKHLAVPTIFTFNFDSLIEQALEGEGIRVREFAMERGAGLPSASLLRSDRVAVIKMHGSTHALLVDEQLDRPLRSDYLERFDRLTGQDPLLLVVGCSQNDRRLRDLVSRVLDKSNADSEVMKSSPRVLWLYYEREPPPFLQDLVSKHKVKPASVKVCETNNPGATLLHLHSWLTNCNPASRVSYLAHVQQPIYRDRSTEDFKKKRFQLISTNHPNPMPTAAQALLVRANYWARNEYHFIWIDLEAVHTLAGVVGSIIDQCRRFDPDLAPSVLPLDIDHVEHRDDDSVDKTIGLAVKRVARALRRARYYVAFDGLEAYAYPATTHHGLTHLAITAGAAARLKSLVTFLIRLKELTDQGKGLGESLIGVSVDALKCRFDDTEAHHGLASCISLDKLREDLEAEERYEVVPVANETNHEFNLTFEPLAGNLPLLTFKRIPPPLRNIFTSQTSPDREDQRKTRLALILLNLSFFRRTRPLVAMRHLLEPLLPSRKANDKSHIDKLLMELSQTQDDGVQEYYLLRQLEGGGFWFNHTVRDYLYSQNTKYTNTPHVGKCLDDKSPPETRATFCRSAAFQLFISAMAHQRIARTWNTYTYVQSQDTFAFLEYTYHQISSVRSLAKLRGLLQAAINTRPDTGAEIIAKAILEGFAQCGELARRMAKDPNDREAAVETFRQLEFETGIEDYAGIEEDSADGDDASPKDDLVNCLEDLLCHGVERTLKDKNVTSVAERVELFLKRRHRRELRGLYRAWTRAEVTLRTKVAAEQLLHWCDELLKDDLEYRCNKVVIRYERDLSKEKDASAPFFVPICYSPFRDGDFIDYKLEKGIIEKFRRLLQDLRVKLWIERSDYLACIKARFEELRHEPDGDLATYELYEFPLSLTASADELKCHKLLDVVDSQLKSNQESSYGDEGLIAGCDVALRNLEKIESRLGELDEEMSEREKGLAELDEKKQSGTTAKPSSADFSQDQANLNEAWLRLLHLRAECQLGRVSMFSHDGFTGDHRENGIDKWVPEVAVDRLSSAKRAIDKGLKELTERDARTRYTPRSVVVDPTADGALYLQYRSLFYMLNGRRRWLATGNDIDRAFAAALWSFEMARGGLGDHNPLVTALIELYTVEALLARSRYVLFEDAENRRGHRAPRPPAHENAIELAEGWYGSARAGLQRVNELLLAGRRNVIWRKFYFRLATQYHSDRLLLNYTILEKSRYSDTKGKDKRMSTGENKRRKSDHKQRASDVEEHRLDWERSLRTSPIRLRRGYQSLLTALDLYLPASSSQKGQSGSSEQQKKPPNRYRWLYRMWWELTLSGYAIGRLAVEQLEHTRSDQVPTDHVVRNNNYVCEEVRWLNEMDGIADSELQEFVNPCYQTLSSHYDALQNIFGKSAHETALLRRSEIIKQALAGPQT